jgi:3-oxoacyl-[acyl-carrier-protein] synthase III
MIAITYTDVSIPEKSFAVDDFVEQLNLKYFENNTNRSDVLNVLKNGMGVNCIYVGDRATEPDIFSELLEKYFENTPAFPEDIGYIIYTRGNSVAVGDPWSLTDHSCINVPYYLQHKFNLINAQIFNVEQECSSSLIALKIAKSLMAEDKEKRTLLLSRNYFENPDKRIMGGSIVVSDGVGILEVSDSNKGLEILDFISISSGKITMVKDLANSKNVMEVFTTGSDLIHALLKKNNLKIDDVACIIPQNISRFSWNFYCKILPFSKDRVFLDNVTEGGHMGDVDIIRNIAGVIQKGILKKGDYVIVYGLGTGTSWNALLLRMN